MNLDEIKERRSRIDADYQVLKDLDWLIARVEELEKPNYCTGDPSARYYGLETCTCDLDKTPTEFVCPGCMRPIREFEICTEIMGEIYCHCCVECDHVIRRECHNC